jgi:uncharacterized protein YggE
MRRPADHVRLDVQVESRGKDVKEAFTKLKELEADVLKRIEAAQEGALEFSPPRIEADNDQQNAYARMMANMGNPAARKKPVAPSGVSVTATLRANWEIKGDSPDAISLAAYELVTKLKAAAPWKPPAAGNELKAQQEQEEAEENVGANPFAAAMPKPGQPTFSYTATFPAADIARATADAFHSAKQRADELAKSAGKSLGELVSLEGQATSVSGTADNPLAEYMAALQGQGAQKPSTAINPDLVTGDQPGAVTAQVTVTAEFQMKGK